VAMRDKSASDKYPVRRAMRLSHRHTPTVRCESVLPRALSRTRVVVAQPILIAIDLYKPTELGRPGRVLGTREHFLPNIRASKKTFAKHLHTPPGASKRLNCPFRWHEGAHCVSRYPSRRKSQNVTGFGSRSYAAASDLGRTARSISFCFAWRVTRSS
jgi:hypothetical protein